MYLVQVSRYDTLFAVNQLARALSKPSIAHMTAVKHLLRYLAGPVTSTFFKGQRFKFTGYSDANWDKNLDGGNSTSSYTVMLCQ